MPRPSCPCCGHLTLSQRGGFEICPVCFWEDDGQDDLDAHVARGGPNQGTLWEARTHFLTVGACSKGAKEHVRPATSNEPQVRSWSLLDGVAVERIPSSDLAPWALLHDGFVTGLERGTHRARLIVEISYLRERFSQPGAAFHLELLNCSHLAYAPYEGNPVTSDRELLEAQPDLIDATQEGPELVVWGSRGALRLRYQELVLRLDTGAPLALAALDACAHAYWEEWARQE